MKCGDIMKPLLKINNNEEYCSEIFSGITEVGKEMNNIEFDDCTFEGCNFSEAIFKKCKFLDCTFTRCNLSVIKVPQSKFTNVVFEDCKVIGVDWTLAFWSSLVFLVSLIFKGCNISDSTFMGLTLDDSLIEDCKAFNVDFRGSSFKKADFSNTDFTNSIFGETNLAGADFTNSINYDIDIFNNIINKAKFSRYEAIRLLYSLDINLID